MRVARAHCGQGFLPRPGQRPHDLGIVRVEVVGLSTEIDVVLDLPRGVAVYYAAVNSKACRLTPLGQQYWRLANAKRI